MHQRLRVSVSETFVAANVALLFLGVYYWLEYSQYRIIILYSVFNVTLFWLTSSRRGRVLSVNRIAHGSLPTWLGISFTFLSGFLMLATSQSLYKRPDESTVVVVALAVLLVILMMQSKSNAARLFQRNEVLLTMFAFLLLYVNFSVYLVQPNLMHGPAYAGVDAYRDYANAERIIKLSGIQWGKMVLERYYRAFPVVPVQIATISLVTGLPCNISHLFIGVTSTLLAVGCSILLACFIIGRRQRAQIPVVAVLSALILLLQPTLIDPSGNLTPLMFSIPLLLLVMYLGLSSVGRNPRSARSCYVSIMLLICVIVPLHAASAIMLILLFTAMALFCKNMRFTRSVSLSIALLALAVLALYLTSVAGTPITSVLENARLVYESIKEIMQTGPSFINELGVRGAAGPLEVNEISSFLMSVPTAVFLAIASVAGTRCVQYRNADAEWETTNRHGETNPVRRNLRTLYLLYALFLLVGFGGSIVLHAFSYGPSRYLALPLMPLALIATALTVKWTMKDVNSTKHLLLLGLLTLYIVSVAMSPTLVQESSPLAARMTPIQSERVAASFVSAELQIDSSSAVQVYADWPFYLHVTGVLLSEHFYDRSVIVPDSLYQPIVPDHRTMVLSREYFLSSAFLKQLSPLEKPLTNSEEWRTFNKIFDDSSTSIYYGTSS